MPSPLILDTKHLSQEKVYFKKLVLAATIPTRGSNQAAGIDLASIDNLTLAPEETKCVKTGLACEFNEGLYLPIAPHSGNALKGTVVNGGVIHQDYRGNIGIILRNMSQQPFQVSRLPKASLRKGTPQIVITETLSTTSRNNNGFSSMDNSNKKRVQVCKFDQDNVYQIDRTKGPGKIRVRCMPTSTL